MSIALLLARLVIGLGLASHGAQKLFGWFGGYGPKGTGQYMESLGWRPGTIFAVAAGLGEFGGGLLIAAGFLNGVGPAIAIVVMLVAILSVHADKGFFAANQGWEIPALYIAGALALDFGGVGQYSIDNALGLYLFPTNTDRWILIGIAVVLAVLNIAVRRRPSRAA